jgi:hypothetical protein
VDESELLKARLLERIASSDPPTRGAVVRRERILVATGLSIAVSIFLASGGFRDWGAPRPPTLVGATFLATAAIAGGALWVAWGRGSSSLGARSSWLWGAALGAPMALLACKMGLSADYPGASTWLADRVGFRCLALSSALGATVLTAFLAARRGTDPLHPGASGAALGVAAGLSAAVLMDLWCPVAAPSHLLLGHVVPVLSLGLAGLLIGRRVLAVQWAPQDRMG